MTDMTFDIKEPTFRIIQWQCIKGWPTRWLCILNFYTLLLYYLLSYMPISLSLREIPILRDLFWVNFFKNTSQTKLDLILYQMVIKLWLKMCHVLWVCSRTHICKWCYRKAELEIKQIIYRCRKGCPMKKIRNKLITISILLCTYILRQIYLSLKFLENVNV